ncbi:MAG: hypothetical protein NC086_11635 [Alistipes sp.]|nr:hypothetical protein [Alistipes sp.]
MTINSVEAKFWEQYGRYTADTEHTEQKMRQLKEKDITKGKDTADISKSGHAALADGNLSSVSAYSVMDEFEKTVSRVKEDFAGEDDGSRKTDLFDQHVRQMTSAYEQMKNAIEEKYASSDRKQEYYVAEDGSRQELTKEKELEMLDKAYENHSRFMAESTQIWSGLRDFKVQIIYHKGNGGAMQPQQEPIRDTKKEIRNQAFSVFMSAIHGRNTEVSPSVRADLNGIWDYFLNRK